MESTYLDRKLCLNHPENQRTANKNIKTKKYQLILVVSYIILIIAIAVLGTMLWQQHCDCVSSVHWDPPCPAHWIMYREKCYYFSPDEANWNSSQNFCSSYNASLAMIENEEKDFIMRFKSKEPYWIGLRRDPNQPWKWISGENATLEVLGNGGDCAFLNNEPKATGSSSRCSTTYRWICSKSTKKQIAHEKDKTQNFGPQSMLM